jgi:hypothetical protein|tara:strand:+ start:1397 stop:1561 length:165 start_codon:yes stop_codon:yes gene_type:complete
MLEEALLSPAVEELMESVGNKTESWTKRWWWQPLRILTLMGPFIAIGIYYFWFM